MVFFVDPCFKTIDEIGIVLREFW